MKLFDVLINTRYQLLSGDNAEIRKLSIDSRNAGKGTMFFCIKGLKSDGHTFIESAVEQGAAAIVIEDDQVAARIGAGEFRLPEHIAVVKVDSSRKALAFAAANFYNNPTSLFNLIGITGTNGKTSTTYFMEAILNEYGKKTGIIGTVETRIGKENINIYTATSTTPDTIELQQMFAKMRDEHVTDVVMEVTSHALALNKTDGIQYNVGIFTNLTQDHLDFHGNMEVYKETKAKLFSMCNFAVINTDDAAGEYMIKNACCPVMTYSIQNESDLQAVNVVLLNNGVEFDIKIKDKMEKFFVPVRGRFTVYNVLGSIGAAIFMGIPVETVQSGLKKMGGVPGRIQSVPNDRGFHVIVDYAHSPDALENIITSVREFTKGKVITVFGCGGDRDKEKRPIMGKIAGELSDYCIITSDNPRTESPDVIIDQVEVGMKESSCPYEKVTDRKDAIERAIRRAEKEDAVIIAGKGHENYQIFADRTVHFDDCETAAEALDGVQS